MCRQSYQRLLSRDGHYHSIEKAAIIIQSYWRGWREWNKFQEIWNLYQPKDFRVRRKKLLKKIEKGSFYPAPSNQSSWLSHQPSLLSPQSSLNTLIDQIDALNINSRKIIDSGVEVFKEKKKNHVWSRFWKNVYLKANNRGDEECCPICLYEISISKLSSFITSSDQVSSSNVNSSHVDSSGILNGIASAGIESGRERKISLLGCSHYMHANCFKSYRNLMDGHACPICRAKIEKFKMIKI